MSRTLRGVVLCLGLLGAAVALEFGRQTVVAAQEDDPPAAQQLEDRGEQIWSRQCALCHGELARGVEDLGPDVREAGTAAIDFMIRTGRMPLPDPEAPVRRRAPTLDDDERAAVVAFYDAALRSGGPDIPDLEAHEADLGRGREIFVQNCAACHGPTGAGIAVGQGDIAPSLAESSPIVIAEAVRVGPGRMPVFSQELLTEQDVAAVTAWVLDLRQRAAPGGAQIGRSGPVSEGAVAWILGMGTLLVVAYLLGERGTDEPEAPREGPSPVDAGPGVQHDDED